MTAASRRRRTLLVALVLGLLFVPVAFAGGGAADLSFTLGTWSPSIDLSSSTTTASQTFTLANSGHRSAGTITVSLSDTTGPFSITADTCTSNGLGPGRSCDVTVLYAPSTPGTTGVTLQADGEHGYQATASLSGTATGGITYYGEATCTSDGGTFSTDSSSNSLDLQGHMFVWSCDGQTQGYNGVGDLYYTCSEDAYSVFGDSTFYEYTSGLLNDNADVTCAIPATT